MDDRATDVVDSRATTGGRWTQTAAADSTRAAESDPVVYNNGEVRPQLSPSFPRRFSTTSPGSSSCRTSSYRFGGSYAVSGGTSRARTVPFLRVRPSPASRSRGSLTIGAGHVSALSAWPTAGFDPSPATSWAIFSTMGTTNALRPPFNLTTGRRRTSRSCALRPGGTTTYQVSRSPEGHQS